MKPLIEIDWALTLWSTISLAGIVFIGYVVYLLAKYLKQRV
jgi:hypothetical protein